MNIVLVEQARAVREALALQLTEADHEIIECASGRDALRRLDCFGVDLIVAAEHLPDMLGTTMASQFRRWLGHRAPPVLVLPSLDDAPIVPSIAASQPIPRWTRPLKRQRLVLRKPKGRSQRDG